MRPHFMHRIWAHSKTPHFEVLECRGGTSCVLSAIATVGIRRMVFTSTTAVFETWPPAGSLPARWTTERNTRLHQGPIYHATKAGCRKTWSGELLLRELSAASILRLGRCFSPPPPPEPLDVMAIHRLCRGIDPRDAAAAHLRALEYADFNAAPLIGLSTNSVQSKRLSGLGHLCRRGDRRTVPRCCGSISNPWLVGAQTN